MKEGYIISHIDKIPVDNLEDLNQILDFKKGGILVEGFYPDGEKAYLAFIGKSETSG